MALALAGICHQGPWAVCGTVRCSMHRLLGIILLGAALAGTADAGEWRTQSEQPFCLNRDDVLQYLLVMNVEGFKGRAVPGCSTLKAGCASRWSMMKILIGQEGPAVLSRFAWCWAARSSSAIRWPTRSNLPTPRCCRRPPAGYRAGVKSGPRLSPPEDPPPSDPCVFDSSAWADR